MTIRPAQPGDASAIKACAIDAYACYIELIGKNPAPMVADFKRQIEQSIVYIASDNQTKIQGFIVFYPREDHVHLENVAVFSQFQGMGIGKKLISYCEYFAKQHSYAKIELYTNEQMTENLELYAHLGYTEFDRSKKDGFNRVFFRKEI